MQAETIIDRFVMRLIRENSPEQLTWHFENGFILHSIYTAGKNLQKDAYMSWVLAVYDFLIAPDGKIKTYEKEEYNLDQINPGKTLFDIYAETGEKKYRIALETLRDQLRTQPRTESGGFWHKKIYPWQIWQDGLYMAVPFYARYALEFGIADDFEDAAAQLLLFYAKARDLKTGLLYHAWDESHKQLWSNQQTGCSLHFLGRGMGQYCMAVADTLDFIPDSEPYDAYKKKLIQILNKLVQAIIPYQDSASGMWFQIMDQGARARNFAETSATSMFVYFLYKSLRKGYIPEPLAKEAEESAAKGFSGICGHMLEEDAQGNLHLNGVCTVSGLGGNPYRDGSFDYYVREPVATDDFKGLGPFLFSCIEQELYLSAKNGKSCCQFQ